ncbi:MAG: gamma-glutamyl-gamma-aminobutyrate hydrolase family protein [Tepidisphaeraceae bacterium]
MPKPLIGITSDYVNGKPQYMTTWAYVEAVEKAGGLPVIIPYKVNPANVSAYVDHLDGLLLSGGDDLDPQAFGEERHLMAEAIDPDRQRFEMALLREAERRGLPVLGICLGLQVMNVYRGGSLHQFLPDLTRGEPLEHRKLDDWTRRHDVTVEPGTQLAELTGKQRLACNTSHKQAIKSLGSGLRITAYAPDGIIEGIEDPSRPFFMAVQWHPERQNDETDHLKIFERLVAHARQFSNSDDLAASA